MHRLVAFLCVACSAAVTPATPARADLVVVNVFDFDFSVGEPDEPIVDVVVSVGDTVRWYFTTSGHSSTSVVGIPEVWNSGYVGIAGETYDHTFAHAGTWWYYCFPHGQDNGDGTASGMAGTVTVLKQACTADLNIDGVLNLLDFQTMVALFDGGDGRADCTSDGLLDLFDFFCFLNAFNAGC